MKTTKKEKQRIESAKLMMSRKMGFGKYGSETIAHVAQFDPTYLDWAVGNGILDKKVITARDRGEYDEVVLKNGYAVVLEGKEYIGSPVGDGKEFLNG